eukprot:3180328-Amphidinium_carterae.1
MDQLREDGGYVSKDDIQKLVYLGEHVRVRVMECTPATGAQWGSKIFAKECLKAVLWRPLLIACGCFHV